jgi:hypothetical protein
MNKDIIRKQNGLQSGNMRLSVEISSEDDGDGTNNGRLSLAIGMSAGVWRANEAANVDD